MPLLLPAALLVIPYADLLLAVVRRTRAGQSPFAPDRKHLHHRLLDIGHSQRASVLIMYLWAAVFSGSVVWLSIQRTEQARLTRPSRPAGLRLHRDHRGGGRGAAADGHAQAAVVAAAEAGCQAGTRRAAGLAHGAAAELVPGRARAGTAGARPSDGAHAGATGASMTSRPRPPVAPLAAPAGEPLAAPPGPTPVKAGASRAAARCPEDSPGGGAPGAGQPLDSGPRAGADATFRGTGRRQPAGVQLAASVSAGTGRQAPADAELPRGRHSDAATSGWQVGRGRRGTSRPIPASSLAAAVPSRRPVRSGGRFPRDGQSLTAASSLATASSLTAASSLATVSSLRRSVPPDGQHARDGQHAHDGQHVATVSRRRRPTRPRPPASTDGPSSRRAAAAPPPSQSMVRDPAPAVTQVPVHPVPRRGRAPGRRSFPSDRRAP